MNRFTKSKTSWLGGLAAEEAEISLVRKFRRFPLEFLDKLELNDAILIPKMALGALKISGNTAKAETSKFRLLLTRLLPVNPLYKETQSPIDLYLLTHNKDVDILPTSLLAAQFSIKENLQDIVVIGPQEIEVTVMEIIERLNLKANFISDEEILTEYLDKSWKTMTSVPRMEVLKILCGLHSKTGKALVVDGDTILLRERTWTSQSRSLLIVAQEYLLRHLNFNELILGQKQSLGLGFVAHHQVLITDELQTLVQNSNGISVLASKFQESYENYNSENNVFPSEWQLIGDLRIEMNPENLAYAKFSNYGVSRDAIKWNFAAADTHADVVKKISELKRTCPGLYSLSLHRYK
jgi:hypothetical protein